MKYLLPLFLITVNSYCFGQRDTLLNYKEKVSVYYWYVTSDSMTMEADTLSADGSFLKISVSYSDSIIIIQGGDSLKILDWQVKRADYSVVRLYLQKETGGEPMPVEGLLLKDFMSLDYPEVMGKRKSVLYTLVDKVKSVSN